MSTVDRTASVIKLHTQRRFNTFGLPLLILAAATSIVLVIGTVANLNTDDLASMREGMRWNGAIWSILGPLMGVGFTAMLQVFPLSLGLGLTRREFAAGTAAVFAIIAGFFTAIITVLKVIEQATDGFGLSVRIFDVVYVGTGPWWQTLVQTFLLLLMAMFIGAALSTVYLRFGQRGLWIVLTAIGLGWLLVIGLISVTSGAWEAVLTAFAGVAWIGWMGVLVGIGAVAALAWLLLIRRAPVR